MSNEISISVVGNAVSDPEHRITTTGVSVTNFRVACNSRTRDVASGRWLDGPSSYYTVTCWRDLADNVARSVVKGQPVMVSGFLRQRTHERADGTKTRYTDIEARAVGHDLSRGNARFERTARGPQLVDGNAPFSDTATRQVADSELTTVVQAA